jgi:hypothetical protein
MVAIEVFINNLDPRRKYIEFPNGLSLTGFSSNVSVVDRS